MFRTLVNPAYQHHRNTSRLIDILKLFNERLSLMKEVAAYKFSAMTKNRMPSIDDVFDQKQEERILISTQKTAEKKGLDVDLTCFLIQTHMNIAKKIQVNWMKTWHAEGNGLPDGMTVRDLEGEIRPAILALNRNMYDAIQACGVLPFDVGIQIPLLKKHINVEHVSHMDKLQLLVNLLSVLRTKTRPPAENEQNNEVPDVPLSPTIRTYSVTI